MFLGRWGFQQSVRLLSLPAAGHDAAHIHLHDVSPSLAQIQVRVHVMAPLRKSFSYAEARMQLDANSY